MKRFSKSFHFNIFCQIAKLVASRNHMAGYDLSHELFKSAYDIEFYSGLCIWSKVQVAFLCPFRGSWKWELPNTSCETVASVFGMFITLFSPIISIYKVQDREKEDAFPLYFEDMMTGHWAGSYYRLIHNYSIYNYLALAFKPFSQQSATPGARCWLLTSSQPTLKQALIIPRYLRSRS